MDKKTYKLFNHTIYIEDPMAARLAVEAGAAEVNHQGTYTTVAMWLSGVNPWGFHNDLRFSETVSAVKLRERIQRKALKPDGDGYILLNGDEMAILQEIQVKPKRHPAVDPMYPALLSAVLPVWEAVETAETQP